MGWREKSISLWAFLFIVEYHRLIDASREQWEKDYE